MMASKDRSPAHVVAGRYRLIRRLGAGAMGVVWQGHDERLDRPVAIKKLLLRPGLRAAETAEKVARCLREGRLAARLHHPNAIAVFDVVDEDGVPNLVMEFMRSRSLATAIDEDGPLPPAQVAAIGAQVAAALVAAHAAGIVHRDITPGNILLGEDGSAKLTDFGISRATDDPEATRTGRFAGTPAYLAPEVALGADPGPPSDLFSLGSTLYAAVEGEPPFGSGQNVLGTLHAVAGGEINPPKRSGPLTDVLLALLATDPDARPTAGQAHDLLAGIRPEEPTVLVAAPATAAPAGTERAGTGRQRALAAAGVLVVALMAVGLWLLGGRSEVVPAEDRVPVGGSEQHQDPANAPVEPAAGEPAQVDETAPVEATAPRTEPTTPAGQQNPVTTTQDTSVAPTTEDQAPTTTTEATTTTPPPSDSEEAPSTAPETESTEVTEAAVRHLR